MTLHPLSITMWDFSWLERRSPDQGYADWHFALSEAKRRGYDVLRIDAYPHLVGTSAEATTYTLLPVWTSNDWGAPVPISVTPRPALIDFLAHCKQHGLLVALSSWFRDDETHQRMEIHSPEDLAKCWLRTLDYINEAGLMSQVLYVDLCNEWPGDLWAPFFTNDPPWQTWSYWHTECSRAYMTQALNIVRQHYPELPLCFSLDGTRFETYHQYSLPPMDLIDHHLWMARMDDAAFMKEVGSVKDPLFTNAAFDQLALNGERAYQAAPEHWNRRLIVGIQALADASRFNQLPLVTTEGWGIVDYKDDPRLPWDYVKDLCKLAVETAAQTHRWLLICTSNFAGPQFKGMWGDIKWHQELNACIHQSVIDPALADTKLACRMRQAESVKLLT